MNPSDLILFLFSILIAAFSIHVNGWAVNGVGPAIVSVSAGFWQLWMQWLRHRSWLRHRNSGFAPATGGLAILAALGYAIGMICAMVWLVAGTK